MRYNSRNTVMQGQYLWPIALLLLAPLNAKAQTFEITVDDARGNGSALIRVPLQLSKDLPPPQFANWKAGKVLDISMPGLLTEPNFVTEKIKAENGKIRKDFIFPSTLMKTGTSGTLGLGPKAETVFGFTWDDHPNDHLDLNYSDGKKSYPVMRYMYKTYDTSSTAARNKTYKVFHHLFDPAGNGKIITNGGHTDDFDNEKDLLYPHHRGLMFAFNKCQYNGKSVDTWHCTNGAHVSHKKTIFQNAGYLMAEHRVLLTWHGPKDEVFAEEERQMTVYKSTASKKTTGTLIEFATRLTPKVAKLRLDGDPQHSGFQFRAHNDVAKKTAKETYYLRPDGKGKPGETRNWDAKKGGPTNLPWDVMCFVLDGKRYSVAYIDHPSNPGEKRYSERDYGRFGCYFEADLTPENPLVLNHRVWLQEGEMTAAQVESLRRAFVDPPKVTVK
jgi:hypothetical protein